MERFLFEFLATPVAVGEPALMHVTVEVCAHDEATAIRILRESVTLANIESFSRGGRLTQHVISCMQPPREARGTDGD